MATGYRPLAYLQTQACFIVKQGDPEMPGLVGTVVDNLYGERRPWLGGSVTAGIPL